jgi:DNA recombination protein RmuC
VCFLPSEALLATALEEDPTLLDHAFRQRVALASPVNLWAVLKTVAYTWTQQEVSRGPPPLRAGHRAVQRLGGLAGHADDLRRAIERTVDSYNRFTGSLESRVLVTARSSPGSTRRSWMPRLLRVDREDTAKARRPGTDGGLGRRRRPHGIAADLGSLRDRL